MKPLRSASTAVSRGTPFAIGHRVEPAALPRRMRSGRRAVCDAAAGPTAKGLCAGASETAGRDEKGFVPMDVVVESNGKPGLAVRLTQTVAYWVIGLAVAWRSWTYDADHDPFPLLPAAM